MRHRISEHTVLIAVAAELGLDPDRFAEVLEHQSGQVVQAHFQETRALMAQVAVRGFPTLALQTGEGLQSVDFTAYLGRPQDFQDWLRSLDWLACNLPHRQNVQL